MLTITPTIPGDGVRTPAPDPNRASTRPTTCCRMASDQAIDGADALGAGTPDREAVATGALDAYPVADVPVPLQARGADAAPVAGFPATPTGVSEADQQAATAQNVSPEGLAPQARRNLDRANEWGLRLTGGVGNWNQWHADGTSVDVSNYAGGGVGSETPQMRAYANEMYELGKAGVKGPDGGLLVTHVVYAGMKAGASTNWEWVPVSQAEDLTQGHWDHVHVETDSWV